MTTTLFILAVSGYIVLVISCAKRAAAQKELGLSRKLKNAEDAYQAIKNKKSGYAKEKLDLQNKALEIFTLYEITKEITNSLNENDAVRLFKSKLHEHV